MLTKLPTKSSRILSVIAIVLLALASLPVSPVFADTAGPNNPGAGSEVNGPGTVGWSNESNILTSNNQRAEVQLNSSPSGNITSEYLQGRNFNFAIPTNAIIQGIQVSIERYTSGVTPPFNRDNEVRLLKAGVISGTNKANTTDDWPTSEGIATYGGVSDLWGTTWTPADINHANFGVALSVRNHNTTPGRPRTAYVDNIQITVTYSVPTSTTLLVSDAAGVYGDDVSLSATISPVIEGLTINFTLGGIDVCDGTTDVDGVASCSATVNENVGIYNDYVGASFSGNANYNASSDTANLTVNARPITITAVTDTKTYDGTTASDGEPTITLGALVPGDTADWSQTFDDANVGTGKTLTPDGTVDDGNNGDNYAVTFVPVSTGEIEALAITVTAVTDTKTYDGTTSSDGEPTITLGALVTGDTADWSQTFDDANVGTGKTLTPDGTVDDGNNGDNYTVTFVPVSTGEIVPADQTITVTTHPPASAPNGASFTVAATSSSGLEVTFSASGACSNVGNTFTMSAGTGTCFVHFDQPGNTNYNPAPQVTESVIATTAPLVTLHPEDAVVKPGGNASFTAEASGDPNPTVQWQVSTDGGLTFSDLLGETSTTLLLTTPPLSDNYYQYRAVFTNAAGTDTSDPATLILLYYRQHLTIILR